MTTKADLAKALVKYDIILSPSQIKKAKLAALQQRLADAEAAATARRDDRSDRTYKTSPDERGDDGLLTEGACFARAEDSKLAKKHGTPEAGGVVDDVCHVTFTDMTEATVDRRTGKVAASNVVPLKPRRSKGVNLAPKPADQIKTCRAGTRQAALIDALFDGATMWELEGVCPTWSRSSIVSGIYYDVNKLKGYGVRTELVTPRELYDTGGHEAHAEGYLGTDDEHERFIPLYRLVLPEGWERPLPHTERAPVKAAANKRAG